MRNTVCGAVAAAAFVVALLNFEILKLFVADLVCLIQDHGLSAQQYADDTQVYGACRPAAVNALSSQITGCVDTVASCMDEVQQASAKCRQNWSHVVRDWSAPAPATDYPPVS